MSYGSILGWLAGVMGVVMSLGYYPQVYAIWKTKSSRDVSLLTYGIFLIGNIVWTLYGLYLKDYAVITGFIIGIPGAALILALGYYYRRKN